MSLSIAQKLKIKEGDTVLIINAPPDYKINLGSLPEDVTILDKANSFNQVHWFVKDRAQMEKELKTVTPLVKNDIICWIFYPKGSSKIQTDLTRDKGWDELLKQNLQWLSLISFDNTWSAFGMRQKTEKDKEQVAQAKDRPIFEYADSKTKTIRLPDDLATAFKKEKKLEEFFNSLSFTNRKEYVEWIVTAKRVETRNDKVSATLERLKKKWKNPANR